MADRGSVRSSARLSGDGAAAAVPRAATSQQARGRPVSGTAAAALRRARAAERAAEVEDSPRVLRDKCRRLARALRNAKHLVVYTGAGISTAADIPDYRGPHGVWTRLQRGETVGRVEVSRAQPTFTHMALTALWARGALKFVVSQNCDGLHLRAGLPRRALAELHGDMFVELCAPCRRVYLRAFDTTERTARHQHGTRRLCHACGQELRDSIVHFGERGRAAWPLNWAGALRHAARADVVLCLGSSLKVLRRYPRLWRMQAAPRARPALYIVNLQWTPKDSVAALKINARCDVVMQQVARRLRLRVPRYRPERDPVLAHAEPLAEPEAHTSRRPQLRPPPAHGPDLWLPSSPSASDSDEELPLRHLAERLRGASESDQPHSPAERGRTPHPGPAGRSHPGPAGRSPSVSQQICGPNNCQRGASPKLVRRSLSPNSCHAHSPKDSHHIHNLNNCKRERSLSPFRIPHCSSTPGKPCEPASADRLHAFQVNMQSGEATILLRAEHATSVLGRARTADLRRFRMARRAPAAPAAPLAVNGHAPPGVAADTRPAPPAHQQGRVATLNGTAGLGSRLRRLLEYEPRIDAVENMKTSGGDLQPKLEDDEKSLKIEPKDETKEEAKEEASASDSSGAGGGGALAAGSLAAAIIRRAVLLCRASLYPGLHTIIAPAPPPAPDCAWCARHYGARRCLWYGPPRTPALAARAWRRVRGRRYLCACCDAGGAGGAGGAPGPAAQQEPDDGGWYGKGYRKGRRRRR